MSIRYLIFFFFIFINLHSPEAAESVVFSEPNKTFLSDQARVSVITCGAGSEIYSLFGHTALRIKDPERRIDLVYNYGTFNFNTPNFYLKFAGGRLAYFLSVSSYAAFESSYVAENRSLSEQVLNLRPEEVRDIFQGLETNLRPENKYYPYQFFSDNCTSRVYNILQEVLREKIDTDTAYIEEKLSYRQLIDPYLENYPWVKLGMNVALGLEADHRVSLEERLFLPLELERALNHSQIRNAPLVREQILLYDPVPPSVKEAGISVPPFLLLSTLALLVLGLSILEYQSGVRFAWVDRFIFGVTGLLGLVLCLLWILSAHTPTHQNLNILWLNPLNLLLAFSPRKAGRPERVFRKLYLFLLLSLVAINFIVPYFEPEFYPLVFILISRLLLPLLGGRENNRINPLQNPS